MARVRSLLFCLILFVVAATGCRSAQGLPTIAPRADQPTGDGETVVAPATAVSEATSAAPTALATTASTPTLAATATSAATSTIAATTKPERWRVQIMPGVPPELVEAMGAVLEAQGGRFTQVTEGESADVTVLVGEGETLATWIYAIAVPFATVNDATTLADLQANWRNGGTPQALADEFSEPLLTAAWGQGAPLVVDADNLVAELWQRRPSWSLVPFHRLDPSLKVLSVDGVSPLDEAFDAATYPLAFTVGLQGNEEAVAALFDAWIGPQTNREPGKITRLAMSGVTALVRATAYQMATRGILYPGEEVGAILQAADLAHVSNEVSFVPDCPPPHFIGDPVFCSDPRYMALLEEIGVDVVELTGNHLNDWGAQYLPYTLDLYDAAGMRYFGGGRDVSQAQQPLVIEHNGNQIAFLGCNPVGPAGGWATADRAGSAPCNYEAFRGQIRQLQETGHVVIVTQQYYEIYHYPPTAQQQADFRTFADAGAAAVSGSQGHHAQGFDFHAGAFIHYGLGNLFFDQMDMMGTRQTMVDTYTIYDNRLLSVQMWTGLIENYARPRQMMPQERTDLLQTLFTASGW